MKRQEQSVNVPSEVKRGRPTVSSEKRHEMRRRIAISTQLLFQQEGYRRISMRRIASDVGCSAMTLYKYYDSKIEILHTLWAGIFEDLFNALGSKRAVGQTPRQYLELLASRYVEYWLDHPEHYRLVFMTDGVNQPDVSLFIQNPDIAAYYQTFVVALKEMSPAELSQSDLNYKAGAMICFLNGIAHNLITISGFHWPSTGYLIDCVMRSVLDD